MVGESRDFLHHRHTGHPSILPHGNSRNQEPSQEQPITRPEGATPRSAEKRAAAMVRFHLNVKSLTG